MRKASPRHGHIQQPCGWRCYSQVQRSPWRNALRHGLRISSPSLFLRPHFWSPPFASLPASNTCRGTETCPKCVCVHYKGTVATHLAKTWIHAEISQLALPGWPKSLRGSCETYKLSVLSTVLFHWILLSLTIRPNFSQAKKKKKELFIPLQKDQYFIRRNHLLKTVNSQLPHLLFQFFWSKRCVQLTIFNEWTFAYLS